MTAAATRPPVASTTPKRGPPPAPLPCQESKSSGCPSARRSGDAAGASTCGSGSAGAAVALPDASI